MDLRTLIESWDAEAAEELTAEEYRVRLPVDSAAQLKALAEMFPGRTREQLITELLSVVLDQVAEAFPYVEGREVIARDGEGDPVFDDVGHIPRFLQLVTRHMEKLQRGSQ